MPMRTTVIAPDDKDRREGRARHNIPSPVDTATAADMIGVTPKTLENWRSLGCGPPHLRISAKLIRYDPRDIEAWKAMRRVHSTSEQIAA